MITGQPDTSLDLARLEREMAGLRATVAAAPRWFFREKYVDREPLDPFYILDVRQRVDDPGDDLLGEPLFATRSRALTVKRITRQHGGEDGGYWQPIANRDLVGRLERFMTMYRDDYLQPPGYRGGLHRPDTQHPRFDGKRFLFRIGVPGRSLVGVGPKMFAGLALAGALRGQVSDGSGTSLVGVTVELDSEAGTVRRQTRAGGLFWFSRVPPGRYRVRMRDQACTVQVIEEEAFGNVRGWLADQDGRPVDGGEVELHAPDGEIFRGWSNASGKFSVGLLPAFKYVLRIPGFLFTTQVSVVSDAVIGGTICDDQGAAIAGGTVLLKQEGREVAQAVTDAKGNFRFDGLLAGRYQIELSGYRLYSKRALGGTIQGMVKGAAGPMVVELVAREKIVAVERTTREGQFWFEDVVPGRYLVRPRGLGGNAS